LTSVRTNLLLRDITDNDYQDPLARTFSRRIRWTTLVHEEDCGGHSNLEHERVLSCAPTDISISSCSVIPESASAAQASARRCWPSQSRYNGTLVNPLRHGEVWWTIIARRFLCGGDDTKDQNSFIREDRFGSGETELMFTRPFVYSFPILNSFL
jgi:hypothetical protein